MPCINTECIPFSDNLSLEMRKLMKRSNQRQCKNIKQKLDRNIIGTNPQNIKRDESLTYPFKFHDLNKKKMQEKKLMLKIALLSLVL